MSAALATVAELHERFRCDPSAGLLWWRMSPSPYVRVGDLVNNVADRCNGGLQYNAVRIRRRSYYVHRIIWAMHYGEWPDGQIDHINGNGLDNRISNLRVVSNAGNGLNKRRHRNNRSGVTGVSWNKWANKWTAFIAIAGQKLHLGYFTDFDEAVATRRHAAYVLGFDPMHGATSEERAERELVGIAQHPPRGSRTLD